MRVRSLWIASAVSVGAFGVAASMPPDFVQSALGGASSAITQEHPALTKKVTKRFVNASLAEVLAWLSLERLSFVADMNAFPEKKITVNLVDQPLGAVLEVIADTFGGRWEQKGDIWTLKPGPSSATTALAEASSLFARSKASDSGAIAGKTPSPAPRLKADPVPTISLLLEAQEKAQKAQPTPEQREKIRKAFEEAREQLLRAAETMRQHLGQPGAPDSKLLEEIQKQVREALDRVSEALKSRDLLFEGGKVKALGEEALKERLKLFDKPLLERRFGLELLEKMKLDPKAQQERFKAFELLKAPEFGKLEGAAAFRLGGQNLSALLDSLTDDQRAKMDKQGYLTPQDLDDKQRALLGRIPEGRWEITFAKNGKKVTLRSGG